MRDVIAHADAFDAEHKTPSSAPPPPSGPGDGGKPPSSSSSSAPDDFFKVVKGYKQAQFSVQGALDQVHELKLRATELLKTVWEIQRFEKRVTSVCSRHRNPVTHNFKWQRAQYHPNATAKLKQVVDRLRHTAVPMLTSKRFLAQSCHLKVESHMYDFCHHFQLDVPVAGYDPAAGWLPATAFTDFTGNEVDTDSELARVIAANPVLSGECRRELRRTLDVLFFFVREKDEQQEELSSKHAAASHVLAATRRLGDRKAMNNDPNRKPGGFWSWNTDAPEQVLVEVDLPFTLGMCMCVCVCGVRACT
jgi:hypothetical protein